jgi:hypothetical protein
MSEAADNPKANERRIQAYLARALDEAEAERFEEELMADDGLASELQRALEIRAALRDEAATPATPATLRVAYNPRLRLALAAAAGVALVAIALPLWLQTPPDTPVFRGVEQRMGLTIEAEGGEVRARWASVPGATGYELRVLASDGGLLDSVEVDATEAVLDLGDEPEARSAAFAEVVALDELGQTLRRSDRVAVTQ